MLAVLGATLAADARAQEPLDPGQDATEGDEIVAPTESDEPLMLFEVRGARALSPEIYRAIAAVPKSRAPTEATRALVETRIRRFMRRAGYELASVDASIVSEGGASRIVVSVDEGRVGKLIYRGAGSFRTLQLQLEFALPESIFNRPMLERRLAEMADRYGIVSYRYLLIPAAAEGERGLIEELELNPRISLIRPGEAYDLHVLLEPEAWETGLRLSAEVDAEGLAGGALYRSADFLVEQSRWEVEGLVGGRLDTGLVDRQLRLIFSRATVEAGWMTPPVSGTTLRGRAGVGAQLRGRQREDLGVERYFRTRFEGTASLAWEPTLGLELAFGFGAELSTRFGTLQREGASALPPAPGRAIRAFSELSLEIVLDPEELRRDMRHRLDVTLRSYRVLDGEDLTFEARGRWKKMIGLGWHELRVSLAGAALFGPIDWPDEEPLGDHLRGVFGDYLFARTVGSATVDLRFSVARDLFKLGLFHDLALFGGLDAARTTERLSWANSFGAGGHVLMLDAFQLSAFYAFGFERGGRFDHGIAATLAQAF